MDQELTHHGVRGMKWGRRRYQNPDGSLTPAGRKRYGVESNYERSTGEHNKPHKPAKLFGKKRSGDIPEENRYLSKTARSMTDKEIDKAIIRLQKEERLKQLSPEEKARAKELIDDQSYRKKSVDKMTDDEIVRSMARAKLESQYKRTIDDQSYRKKSLDKMSDDEIVRFLERKRLESQYKDADGDRSYSKKSLGDMSNEEIARALDRANLERQYRQAYPEHVSAGKKFMQGLMNDVVAPAAKSAGRDFLEKSLKKLGENLLKDNVDPDGIESLKKLKEKLGLKKDIKDLNDELAGKKKDDDKRTDLEKERDEWKTKADLKKYKDQAEGKDNDDKRTDREKERDRLSVEAKIKEYQDALDGKNKKPESAEELKKRRDLEEYLWKNDPQFRKDNPSWGERHTNEGAQAKADREAEATAKIRTEAKSFVDNIIKKTTEQLLLPEGDSKANKAWNKAQKKAEKEEASRVNKMRDDLKSKLNQMKDNIKWTPDDDGYTIHDPEPRSKTTNNNTKKSTNDTVIETTFVDNSYIPVVYSPSTRSTVNDGQSFTNQWGQYLLPSWKDEDR